MKSCRDIEPLDWPPLTPHQKAAYEQALRALEVRIQQVREGKCLMEDFVRELSREHQSALGYSIGMTRFY